MPLETIIIEKEPVTFLREKTDVVDVPVVNFDEHGNNTINYYPMEFTTLEFYGGSYKRGANTLN